MVVVVVVSAAAVVSSVVEWLWVLSVDMRSSGSSMCVYGVGEAWP